jgi:hypothetical protein
VAVSLILTSRSRRIFFFGLPPLCFGLVSKHALLPFSKVSIASFFFFSPAHFDLLQYLHPYATNGSRRQVCPLAEGLGGVLRVRKTQTCFF